jgi:hypothetical protein
MDAAEFYRIQGPTEWGGAPKTYSYSSLKSIHECPLRWQLTHATYGSLKRCPRRYDKAAFEGTLVHDMLDKLFRALALQGLPPKGGKEFRQAVANLGIMKEVREAVTRHEEKRATSPRSAGASYTSSPRQIYNRVSRQFQTLYEELPEDLASEFTAELPSQDDLEGEALVAALRSLGVMTELRLRHPSLEFGGIVDFLTSSGGKTTVGDFKTGSERPEHQRQVEIYGLLWYRQTGDVPASLQVRYPNGVVEHGVSKDRLEALEEELLGEITAAAASLKETPGPARGGDHCSFCSARQYCDPYWAALPAPDAGKRRGDTELTILEAEAENAVLARTACGKQFPVVFDDGARGIHGALQVGETVRVLGTAWGEEDEGRILRLTRGSEVFRRE